MKFSDYVFLLGLALMIKGGFNDNVNALTFMLVAYPFVYKALEALEALKDRWTKGKKDVDITP